MAEEFANRYYAPGDQRADQVRHLFNRIAVRYDLINDAQSFGLHRWWKRKLIRLARPAPGRRALDVCCGTGDVVLALARSSVETCGLDFSPAMLAVARKRAAGESKAASPPPLLLRGDALSLPFLDDQFDLVTISYGLRNLANVQAGLEEMWRVTKPGGQILVLDFGKPVNRCWRWMYFQYLRWVVPVFGKVLCGDSAAYAYILKSLLHYPAQAGVAHSLTMLGCQHVRIHNFLGGVMSINQATKAAV